MPQVNVLLVLLDSTLIKMETACLLILIVFILLHRESVENVDKTSTLVLMACVSKILPIVKWRPLQMLALSVILVFHFKMVDVIEATTTVGNTHK